MHKIKNLLGLGQARLAPALAVASLLLLVLASNVFAVIDYDHSDDITTEAAGLITAAIAMVAVTFGLALSLRFIFKGARIALKSVGLIR